MNLTYLKTNWVDLPEYHKHIHESFCDSVNNHLPVRAHRDYVEAKIWGFGERSFHWLWKIIFDELPENPNTLEIGVFRGATLSLWRMLRKDALICGITPLSSDGGYWDSDYANDIKKIHADFRLDEPIIIQEYSNSQIAVEYAKEKTWDLIYVDGSHRFEDAIFDLNIYSKFIKVGGYLVIDDCNVEMNLWDGAFRGHQQVTDAKLEWLKENPPFEFICSVVHISVFKRTK